MDDRKQNVAQAEDAAASTSGLALPPVGGVAKGSFAALCAIALVGSFALPMLSRQALYVWQSTRAENATAMVCESLLAGPEDRARKYAERALYYFPTRDLEGEALVLLAPHYARMANQSSPAAWTQTGRAAAFRSIRERHRVARALEYVVPWQALAWHYEGGANESLAPVLRLLVDHGVRANVSVEEEKAAPPTEDKDHVVFDFAGGRPIARPLAGSGDGKSRITAPPFAIEGGLMRMDRPGAVTLDFEISTAIDGGDLVASATELLGVYPILIASIDDGEEFPLYLDEEEARAFRFPAKLEAGEHELRLEFVNAHSIRTKHGPERRRAVLHRLIFSSASDEGSELPES